MRQKSEQLELALEARGEAPQGQRSGEASTTFRGNERSGADHQRMEQVVGRANALAALKRVKQNRGSPGVDGMTVDDLTPYLATYCEVIRESWPTAWWWGDTRARRRAAPCRRCWPTCCWTKWTRHWRSAASCSRATRTT